MTIRTPGIFGHNNTGPLLLLFSTREKVRDILTVGLIQCNYQVIQAQTSYLASIKASQMLPKIVIADISNDNPKDILIVARLQKSIRMHQVGVLVILPKNPPLSVMQIIDELNLQSSIEFRKKIATIGYPFAFAEILAKLKQFNITDEPAVAKQTMVPPPNISIELCRAVEHKLTDMAIPPATKLQDIGKVLHKQWAFPFTIVKALDIIESDASCSLELAKCISTDPAVSSTVLKISNTVQYARRHGRITEVRDAVVRLGFKETRNILACLSMIDLSPEVYKNRGFGRREFWLHSLAVAVIAEKICVEAGFHRPELAFIAGLLHDLGKIPLDNNFETIFPKLLDETISSITAFYETEQRIMNFTHAQLGHHLTTQWNFPSSISLAILNHHNVDRILQTTAPFDKILQGSVYVANLLAKAANLGHSCDEILAEIPIEIMKDLRLDAGPGERFFNSVIQQLRFLCTFLNLPYQELNIGAPRSDVNDADILVVYNDKKFYHPVVVALRNNGFNVHVIDHFLADQGTKAKVIIVMPDKGFPLDVVFYGDEKESQNKGDVLKIFMVDLDQYHDLRHGISDENLIFMDRQTFDVRVLLHTLDTFLGRIITPQNIIDQNTTEN